MMMDPIYDRLLSFASVQHAIRAERLLQAAGIATCALPTPREIDISCGQCLLFTATNQARVEDILEKQQVEWSKLFKCNSKQRVYEEIERK